MTPYEITLLLEIYTSLEQPRTPETELRAETLSQFLHSGLIKPNSSIERGYITTDKLGCYIDALCNLPLPVQSWSMPKD